MSEPPPENPYGPPPPNPYGQPPGQQPAGSTPPYGQPYGQPPTGPPPYGQPAPYHPYGAPLTDPDRRPGTVTAACVITLASSGLVLAIMIISALVLTTTRNELVDQIRQEPSFEDINPDDIVTVGMVVIAVLAVWCVVALVLAVLALRRSNGARITLVVSASVTALLSLLGITSGVSAVTLLAAGATIICFFTGGANAWYARRGPG